MQRKTKGNPCGIDRRAGRLRGQRSDHYWGKTYSRNRNYKHCWYCGKLITPFDLDRTDGLETLHVCCRDFKAKRICRFCGKFISVYELDYVIHDLDNDDDLYVVEERLCHFNCSQTVEIGFQYCGTCKKILTPYSPDTNKDIRMCDECFKDF